MGSEQTLWGCKEMWKCWRLKETVATYKSVFVCKENPLQNILGKKINQDMPKNFDICFCAFFECQWQKTIFLGQSEQ